MKLTYQWDPGVVDIEETAGERDIEFRLRFTDAEPHAEHMKELEKHFEENRVHTDVFMYAYPNREYRLVVRNDYYVEFILELMKHRILRSVKWSADPVK
ncbi:hypothetical protein [Paenibacillus alkalitolerans]|uniref:hypothetical protein n=1 Tax=Paenibacillus alkalitolerans TaxID=2799335 RepID=UPI0018F763AB|nr:hypothetical protein [Paenibacillus alkalitolerans]